MEYSKFHHGIPFSLLPSVLRKAEKIEIKLGHPLHLEDPRFVDDKYKDSKVSCAPYDKKNDFNDLSDDNSKFYLYI